MSQAYEIRSAMRAGEEAVVVEDRRRRRMTGKKPRARRIKGKLEYMPPATPGPPAHQAPGRTGAEPEGPALPPERNPPPPPAAGQETGERYIRLQVRVEGDEMRVVGAKVVEGPLLREKQLQAPLVYEAAVGERQLNTDSIVDVGVMRSFPPDEPEGNVKGHHITELSSYEFAVRVPQAELAERDLARLRISVYRLKAAPPAAGVTEAPLLQQFPQELRPVAEIKGLRLDTLPTRVQGEIRDALAR